MHLFAYGTLMCPEIIQRVTNSLPTALPARLDGYRRGPLTDVDYPAISPRRGASVRGLLYLDLPPAAWTRLDLFEGDIYYRCPVEANLADDSSLQAETYVLRPQYLYRLSESEWNFAQFLKAGKARFYTDQQDFPGPPES